LDLKDELLLNRIVKFNGPVQYPTRYLFLAVVAASMYLLKAERLRVIARVALRQ
jgi:hypothetical protein